MRKTSLSLHKTRIGGKLFWQVTVPKLGGGRERRTFKDRAEAQTFLDISKVQRENFGNAALSISEALRVEALECEQELSAFGKTLRDATKFYVTYLRQRETSLPVASAVEELIAMKRAAHKSARYVQDLGLRLGRFKKTYGERSVASITGKELDGWLAGLAVAPGTRNTFRRDIRTLFSFCTKRGYCPTNEAQSTERAEDVDKPPGILSPDQCSALLEACGNDVLPYVAISLFAGLRAAEFEKLDWKEVDFISGYIEVTAAKSKTKRRRLVPISENLAAWIRPWAALAGPVAPVGLRKRFDAVKALAGLTEWPQNAMRHSFGSYRLADCQNAAQVSLEMGNSPQMVFGHYRELVKPADATRFWNLRPASAANIVEMTA